MSFITARSPVSAEVVLRSLRGLVSVKKDGPSVGVSDSCQSLAVRCQRRFGFGDSRPNIRSSVYRLVGGSQAYQHDHRLVLGSWQYGASGCSSVGVSARSLISRVVFHRHISAESSRFRGSTVPAAVRVSVGKSAQSLIGSVRQVRRRAYQLANIFIAY